MSGHIETLFFPEIGLPIQIEARPYPGDVNAIEVTCTIKGMRGMIRSLVFREVREII